MKEEKEIEGRERQCMGKKRGEGKSKSPVAMNVDPSVLEPSEG